MPNPPLPLPFHNPNTALTPSTANSKTSGLAAVPRRVIPLITLILTSSACALIQTAAVTRLHNSPYSAKTTSPRTARPSTFFTHCHMKPKTPSSPGSDVSAAAAAGYAPVLDARHW